MRAVAFGHYGKALFEVFRYLGVEDVEYNKPSGAEVSRREPVLKVQDNIEICR